MSDREFWDQLDRKLASHHARQDREAERRAEILWAEMFKGDTGHDSATKKTSARVGGVLEGPPEHGRNR